MKIDALIIGGGMAGLWTLAILRARGYGAVLLDIGALGGMQTLTSQGIIHGNPRYSLTAPPDSQDVIQAVSTRWRDALRGHGEVNLRDAHILCANQYLWTADSLGGRFGGFMLSRRLGGHLEKCSAEAYPPFLPRDFRGHCYTLNAAVLDIPSVLQTIAQQYAPWILSDCFWKEDGRYVNVLCGGAMHRFLPRRIIYTAGRANGELTGIAQQTLPLRMAALRVPKAAPDIFGHHLDGSNSSGVTITTHREKHCKIYYLGGASAEEGAHHSENEYIAHMRATLLKALPWLNKAWFTDDAFHTFTIERVAGEQEEKGIYEPVILQRARKLIAWPGKLTFAPLLAERLFALLPPANDNPDFQSGQIPRIGSYPWAGQTSFLQ